MGTDKTFPKTGATTVGMLTLVALFVACEPRVKIEAPGQTHYHQPERENRAGSPDSS